MCDTMLEIDKSIEEYIKKQELDDYIQSGVYPERLKINNIKPYKYSHIISNLPYNIEANSLDEFAVTPNIKISTHTELVEKIDTLEKLIQDEVEKMNEECPICMEKLGDSFVSPKCGHTVCIDCFAMTVRQNHTSCNKCCLCRDTIISD